MELGMWGMVVPLLAAISLAAVLGWWHDLTHRPRREHFLTQTKADTVRAKNLSDYYVSIHGTEW